MLNIHQIIYLSSHRAEFQPVANGGQLTAFFENEVIRRLHLEGKLKEGALTGVVSHAFRQKTAAAQKMKPEQCLQYAADGWQVVAFYPTYENKRLPHNPWQAGNNWHKLKESIFSEICQLIINRVGLDVDVSRRPHPRNIIYSNHFFATPAIYARYCEEVLLPAMRVMEEDEEIKRLCFQNAHYTRQRQPQIMRLVREQLGIPYYPLHPFILERMPTAFLEKNPDITVKQYGL